MKVLRFLLLLALLAGVVWQFPVLWELAVVAAILLLFAGLAAGAVRGMVLRQVGVITVIGATLGASILFFALLVWAESRAVDPILPCHACAACVGGQINCCRSPQVRQLRYSTLLLMRSTQSSMR